MLNEAGPHTTERFARRQAPRALLQDLERDLLVLQVVRHPPLQHILVFRAQQGHEGAVIGDGVLAEL